MPVPDDRFCRPDADQRQTRLVKRNGRAQRVCSGTDAHRVARPRERHACSDRRRRRSGVIAVGRAPESVVIDDDRHRIRRRAKHQKQQQKQRLRNCRSRYPSETNIIQHRIVLLVHSVNAINRARALCGKTATRQLTRTIRPMICRRRVAARAGMLGRRSKLNGFGY